MANGKPNVIREGAHLLWRRQRVLWWLYGINLFLGLIGTLPTANNIGAVLNHSLAAEHLVKSFDVSFFVELAAQPSHPVSAGAPASLLMAVAFFVLWLLFEGGILETYRRDSRLTTSELFEACGRMFWRFVRLLICMLIALAPIVIIARGVIRNRNSGGASIQSPATAGSRSSASAKASASVSCSASHGLKYSA